MHCGCEEPGGLIDDVIDIADSLVVAAGCKSLALPVRQFAAFLSGPAGDYTYFSAFLIPLPSVAIVTSTVVWLAPVIATCSVSGAVRFKAEAGLVELRNWQQRRGMGGVVRGLAESFLPAAASSALNGLINADANVVAALASGRVPSLANVTNLASATAGAAGAAGANGRAFKALAGAVAKLPTQPPPPPPIPKTGSALAIARAKAIATARAKARARAVAVAKARARAILRARIAAAARARNAAAAKRATAAERKVAKVNPKDASGSGVAAIAAGAVGGFFVGGPVGAVIGAGIGYAAGR